MTGFLQALLNGVAQGAIYALIALGFVMIYKATKVISFAQPGLVIVGGLGSYHFATRFDAPFWVAMFGGIVVAVVVALIIERVALRPLVGKAVFTLAIVTIGIDIVLRTLSNMYIGSLTRFVRYPNATERVEFGGLWISQRSLGLLAVTAVVLILLALFFRFTKYGLAMRATALDQETAMAQGIKVGAMFALAWAIAGALAAIAGTFEASAGAGIGPGSWMIALMALPAIIIGGLESFPGAVIGGLTVGIVVSLSATYQSVHAPWLGQNFQLVAPYALMFIVLLVRPYGLFGTKEVERV